MGVRKVPFSRVLWIERDDVREVPPPKYFRLYPGNEVRLRYAYIVRCTGVVKDPTTGEIVEVRCTYDPASRGGQAGEGRRVKGTIHWVSAPHALTAEARLYDRLFTHPNPGDEADGQDVHGLAQPGVDGGRARCPRGAEPGRRPAGQPLPVRAPGLLLRRSRHDAGPPGPEPHGRAPRHLGQDRQGGRWLTGGESPRLPPFSRLPSFGVTDGEGG